jgi:hypothetical protein
VAARVAEALRALVAQEVVPREDVVHLEALSARVALADVALEEAVLVQNGGALPVVQEVGICGTAA